MLIPYSDELLPSSMTVSGGLCTGGNVETVRSQDGQAMRFAKKVGIGSNQPMTVESKVSVPANAVYLWLKLRTRASRPVVQRVDLWDVQTNAWVSAPTSVTNLNADWQYTERVAVQSLDHYRAGDGTVRARVQFDGPSAFVVDFDQAVWELVRDN